MRCTGFSAAALVALAEYVGSLAWRELPMRHGRRRNKPDSGSVSLIVPADTQQAGLGSGRDVPISAPAFEAPVAAQQRASLPLERSDVRNWTSTDTPRGERKTRFELAPSPWSDTLPAPLLNEHPNHIEPDEQRQEWRGGDAGAALVGLGRQVPLGRDRTSTVVQVALVFSRCSRPLAGRRAKMKSEEAV